MTETILTFAAQIQATSGWLNETKARLLAVENCTDKQEPRIVELEKQMRAITERLDMAEKYNRRFNIRVVCLPIDMETDGILKMISKAGRIKLESAHRTLAPKQEPPGRHCFFAFRRNQGLMDVVRQDVGYNGTRGSFYSDFYTTMKMKRKV